LSEPSFPRSAFRVLLVTEPSGGGSGRHVIDLARELTALGHSVSVVYSPVRAEPMFLRELERLSLCAVEAIPMRRAVGPWDVRAAWTLRRLIDRLGPFDVIHGHSSKAGALVRLVAPRGAARVYTPHAFRTMDPELKPWLGWIYGGAEWALASLTDCALVGSEQEHEEALRLGLRSNAVRRIVFGLAEGPQVSRLEARNRIGLGDQDVIVGFVGRLTHQKAPERIIEAVAGSRHRELRLVIAGDGDQSGQLRTLIHQRGLTGRVIMLGWADGRAVMPAFDLLAVPSRYESLGYVYIEALAARVPVLASPTGLAPGLYADGRLGYLVEEGSDQAAWTAALDICIDRIATGFEIRDEDCKAFSIAAMGHDVVEAYADVTACLRTTRT